MRGAGGVAGERVGALPGFGEDFHAQKFALFVVCGDIDGGGGGNIASDGDFTACKNILYGIAVRIGHCAGRIVVDGGVF